jgi:tRNA G18 (ribose-2'-O)-methylase SpoU
MKVVAILHDIRSVINVGAIFRTCDAAGISKIYLTGITPTPLDRFGRTRKDLEKAALSAEKTVAWEFSSKIESVLEDLKKAQYKIIAIEQSPASVDYKKVREQIDDAENIAFLVGNEVGGVPADLLKLADIIAEIPMKGQKESLNVSTAFGVAVFRILEI